MAQLEYQMKIEVQQTMIDELSSRLRNMEGDFQVQSKLKDRELASLREKCERFQSRVKALEDNSPRDEQLKFDLIQSTLDAVIKENESLKKTNRDMSHEIVDLKSQLARELKNVPVASFDSVNLISKLNDHIMKCENADETMSSDECTDRCVIEMTELNEEPVIAAVVECGDQRAAEVQQSHSSNEMVTGALGNSIGCESKTDTSSIRCDGESTSLDAANSDTTRTSTEERCCRMTTGLTRSVLNVVNEHVGTISTAENDKETQCIDNASDDYLKLNPIGALQELCMSRGWKLPEYKFFEEGSKNVTYSIECTVMSCTVRVEGTLKKATKRRAATSMYYKVRNSTGSNIPLENDTKSCIPEQRPNGDGMIIHSSWITSARPDEELTVDTVGECVAERVADEIHRAHSNSERTAIIENNPSYGPTPRLLDVHCAQDDKKIQLTERIELDAGLQLHPIGDNGVVGDTCVFTSVGCPENPDIVDVVDEDEMPAKVNEDSTFGMAKEAVGQPAILAGHDADGLRVASERSDNSEHRVPSDDSAVVSDDQYYLMSPINAGFANRFRQSNNPSVRELKKTNDLTMLSIPSSLEFLELIAEEEGLVLDFDYYPSSAPSTDGLTTIQLTVNHCALTVVGHGETLIDGQEDASYECLIHLKCLFSVKMYLRITTGIKKVFSKLSPGHAAHQ